MYGRVLPGTPVARDATSDVLGTVTGLMAVAVLLRHNIIPVGLPDELPLMVKDVTPWWTDLSLVWHADSRCALGLLGRYVAGGDVLTLAELASWGGYASGSAWAPCLCDDNLPQDLVRSLADLGRRITQVHVLDELLWPVRHAAEPLSGAALLLAKLVLSKPAGLQSEAAGSPSDSPQVQLDALIRAGRGELATAVRDAGPTDAAVWSGMAQLAAARACGGSAQAVMREFCAGPPPMGAAMAIALMTFVPADGSAWAAERDHFRERVLGRAGLQVTDWDGRAQFAAWATALFSAMPCGNTPGGVAAEVELQWLWALTGECAAVLTRPSWAVTVGAMSVEQSLVCGVPAGLQEELARLSGGAVLLWLPGPDPVLVLDVVTAGWLERFSSGLRMFAMAGEDLMADTVELASALYLDDPGSWGRVGQQAAVPVAAAILVGSAGPRV